MLDHVINNKLPGENYPTFLEHATILRCIFYAQILIIVAYDYLRLIEKKYCPPPSEKKEATSLPEVLLDSLGQPWPTLGYTTDYE